MKYLLTIVFSLSMCIGLISQEIVLIEYFFNSDPGYGNATQIIFTPDSSIEITVDLPLSGLPDGFHTLYIRTRDTIGNWSFIQKRTFLKDLVEVSENKLIITAEYFFDDDPGYGNGTALTINSGPTIAILENLQLAELTNGFHTIYIRTLDEFGNWSFIQKRTFIKDQYARGGPVPITELEYFIDSDPGQGNGFDLPGEDDIEIIRDTTFSLNDLTCGMHTLYTRAKNEAGIWSFPQRRTFLFDDNRIEFAEFKFDSIFFYSDWTDANPFAPNFEILADIDIGGICDLDPGWYHIDARVRREKSWWSDEYTDSIEIKNFYDQTGLLKDQFGDPIPMAQIDVQSVGTHFTSGSGQYAFAVPKCWGDSILFQKDSLYSALNSYVFNNPILDYSPNHILGDIDSTLFGYKCINESGVTGNTNLRYLCEGGTQNTFRSGEVIDTGNIAGFILHDEQNTLGTIYEMNISGSFTNNGAYPQNQKLFISPAVGRPGDLELIDVDHKCTDIMLPGKPIVFLDVIDSVFLVLDSMGLTIEIDPDTLLANACTDCDIQSLTLSQTGFDCDDHGINAEQLTIDNGNGNSSSCSIVVQVDDFILPIISCRTDTTVIVAFGLCGFTSTNNRLEPINIWDNCPFNLLNDFDNTGSLNGDLIPPGEHLILWTIDDNHGNMSQCSFTITVIDNDAPVLNCPSNVTLEIGPGKCDTAYNYSITTDDNCPSELITLESGIGSGGLFSIGNFIEAYKVVDAAGNEATCSFNITVLQLIKEIQDTICFEDSIYLEAAWQFLPGIFVDTFLNVNGCDSIVLTTVDTTTTCYWPTEIVYVDSSATGANNGFDWENAYVDLQFALNAPVRFLNIDQIWTANGTYFPTAGLNRLISFVLPDSLDVLGGFVGTEVDISDRDYVLNKTVLSGDIGITGDSLDNSYHVVVLPDSVAGILLDGFTIRDGAAIGVSPENQVGGGLVNFGKMTLANGLIQLNTSINPGAQILNSGSSAFIILNNTIILGNSLIPILNEDQAILKVNGSSTIHNE